MVGVDLHEQRRVGLGALRICEEKRWVNRTQEVRQGGTTDLNSRLRALTASFAFDSLEDARSQTSRTRAQSSEAVAVR